VLLDELFALKHLDVIQVSDHGVVVKVMRGNMIKTLVGNFGSSNNLDFRVSGLRMPWPDVSSP
jgi:hypothetical protein